MKILAAYFPAKKIYKELKQLFVLSVNKAMPSVELVILERIPVQREKYNHQLDTATGFHLVTDYLLEHDEEFAVADIDIYFRRSIEDAWETPFDLGFTVRRSPKYNTGLWFYRPSGRPLLKLWKEKTRYYERNYKKLILEIRKQGGIDQKALYEAIIEDNGRHTIAEFPCLYWNACQDDWHNIQKNTRAIHVKSKLRAEFQGKSSGVPHIRKLGRTLRRVLNESSRGS